MWNSVVLTLFLIDATNSIDSGSRALERPSNLRVGERNHNNVTLLWDFMEPENVTLRSVEFSLYLQSVGNPERRFHPRFESGPFIYRIIDLFPKTEYIVKLFATTPDWQDSETVSTSFLTLAAELPIPVIMSAVGKPHGNFVEYLVTYGLQPPPSRVLRFEIHVCDSHCFEYSRNGTERTAIVAVEFQSNFSITVTACYGEGEGGLVRLESKPFLGTTGISPFADALSFVAEKQGNEIMLGWHPPYHPKGPTSYYEIFVCDPTKEDCTVWDEEPPRSAEDPPLVTDDAYDLTFETDEVEADLSHSPILGQCATHEPLLLVMVNTTESSFRFRIVFTKPPMDRFYQLDTFADRRRLFIRPYIAESLSLPPFSRIHIKIRNCAIHDGSPNDSCGKFVDFELRTSVAGPSEVLSAEITQRDDSLLISWQEPEEPNGPIDGYKLTIEGYGGSPKKIEKYIFEPYKELNTMFYTMEGYSDREGYNVGIAAFNWDLDNSSEIHIGKWIHMTTHASWISHFGPVILGLVVFSLGLFTLMSCLFRAVSRENIVSPERVETPEPGWAQPEIGAGVE